MLFSKLVYIRDMVTYEVSDLKTLEQEFHASVDGYLKNCAATAGRLVTEEQ